jgi:hypothetical protein
MKQYCNCNIKIRSSYNSEVLDPGEQTGAAGIEPVLRLLRLAKQARSACFDSLYVANKNFGPLELWVSSFSIGSIKFVVYR